MAIMLALLPNIIRHKGDRPRSGRESSPFGLNPVIHTMAKSLFKLKDAFKPSYVSFIHAFNVGRFCLGTIQKGNSFAAIGTTDNCLIFDFKRSKVSETRTLSDDFFCHSSL